MSFVDSLLDISLIVMPVAGYIPQYLSMRKTRSVEGFSPLVSFILLIANMLRIFFWIDKQFDSVLLYQSFVMIAAQIILLEEGEILATGTHEELMESSPEYVQIFNSQRSTNHYEL